MFELNLCSKFLRIKNIFLFQMPLFAVGLTEHETPFTFGSAVPHLSFKWSVNKKSVTLLQSVFHEVSNVAVSRWIFGDIKRIVLTGHKTIHVISPDLVGFSRFCPPLPDGPPDGLNFPLLAFFCPIFLPTDQFLCLR